MSQKDLSFVLCQIINWVREIEDEISLDEKAQQQYEEGAIFLNLLIELLHEAVMKNKPIDLIDIIQLFFFFKNAYHASISKDGSVIANGKGSGWLDNEMAAYVLIGKMAYPDFFDKKSRKKE